MIPAAGRRDAADALKRWTARDGFNLVPACAVAG